MRSRLQHVNCALRMTWRARTGGWEWGLYVGAVIGPKVWGDLGGRMAFRRASTAGCTDQLVVWEGKGRDDPTAAMVPSYLRLVSRMPPSACCWSWPARTPWPDVEGGRQIRHRRKSSESFRIRSARLSRPLILASNQHL